MPTLFTSYYEKHYKAPCCSFASLCALLIYIIAILVPFLFVFNSGGKCNCYFAYSFIRQASTKRRNDIGSNPLYNFGM